MLLILHKGVAEQAVTDGSLFARVTPHSQMGQMESDDFVKMSEDLKKPGAATAGLNVYR